MILLSHYHIEKCLFKVAIILSALAFLMFSNNAYATMDEALAAARNRDFEAAFKLFYIEAEQGNREAEYHLANMYKAGQGTQKNAEKAIEWYTKAADQGHLKAQKKLTQLQQGELPVLDNAETAEQSLLKASSKGDLALVRHYIKSGADVNYGDGLGITALMEATYQGNTKIVDFLLKSGAKPDMRNKDKDAPLLIAANRNSLDIVKLLVKYGADIDIRDKQNSTPLMFAIYRENIPLAKFLLHNKADVFATNIKGRSVYDVAVGQKNGTLIQMIKTSGGKKLANLLADKERKENLQQLEHQSDNNKKRGWSSVMYAAWRGDETAVKAALSEVDDINLRDRDGLTALGLAAQGGHLSVIYLLLDGGAHLNCDDDPEKHPFYLATKQGHSKVVKMLLPALKESPACQSVLEHTLAHAMLNGQSEISDLLIKEGVNFEGNKTLSPLILMATSADDNLVTKLIDGGVDVNKINVMGETALMIAAKNGNQEGVKSLLRHNALIDIKDSSGRTALIHAAQNGHLFSVKYLSEQESILSTTTNEGNTALMLAAEKGHVDIVAFLSQYDDIDHKNNMGDTALIMAARSGSYEVTEILLKAGANPRIRNSKRQKAHDATDEFNKKLLTLIEEYESSRSFLKDIF
ncbi:MAG: ankyrin repeat domain-containing protein [Emcibacter sp.]|nr:ankyrin repeat domain-containing protein [Emcibacter sp.]